MERGWRDITPNCPRCGSSNTKFCYYNNYSLTQPRYFCKGCRRYWTKGGSLRNVPVGGGCRKSRRSRSSHVRLVSAPSNHHNHHGVAPSSTLSIFGHVDGTNNSIQVLPHNNNSYISNNGNLSTMVESSTQLMGSGAPTIDLAVVYANFLNQKGGAGAGAGVGQLRSSVPFCENVDLSNIPDATTIVHNTLVSSQTFPMPQLNNNEHDHSRFFDTVDFEQHHEDASMQHELELVKLPPLPGESSSSHVIQHQMQWITSNNVNNNININNNINNDDDDLLIGGWMSPIDLPGFETSSSPSKPR
ncbi:hypothetical protein RND81_08G161500 [Saponaria officinalis]|uniref:Dof zinc finger protein n=1 Tax=Saponaria officinalis TaxID=3572 RepID=A0AAW1J822_SAPOF